MLWDTDDVQSTFNNKSVTGVSVAFDGSTGRGTIGIIGGYANGLFDQATFYLTKSGTGFVLDSTAGSNNRALAGCLKPQIGGGSFGGADLSGKMIFRWTGRSLLISNQQNASEGLASHSVNSTASTISFTNMGDFAKQSQTPIENSVSSGTEAFTIDTNTGRGSITLGSEISVFYIIGVDEYVFIDESLPLSYSRRIVFVEPQ